MNTFEIDMSQVDTSYWRDHPNMARSEGLWPGYHCNLDKGLHTDFGITCGDYYKLYDKQKGRCRICRKRQVKRFDVDHDPDTGLFCGLLCKPCNRNLSAEARDYVKNPPGEEFQIYVKSARVRARDKRLADKRALTAQQRANGDTPKQEAPINLGASADDKLKRALESSTK